MDLKKNVILRGKVSIVSRCGTTEKRILGRSRRKCEDNITMDLKEIEPSTRNLIDSAGDRNYWRPLVNAALNL